MFVQYIAGAADGWGRNWPPQMKTDTGIIGIVKLLIATQLFSA